MTERAQGPDFNLNHGPGRTGQTGTDAGPDWVMLSGTAERPSAESGVKPDGGMSSTPAMDLLKQGAKWMAPVVGTALKEEAGIDPYRFSGEGQPELTEDQQFVTGFVRWAGRRGAQVLAERAAAAH